ncbi:3-phosphoshikimate 1-carboxyvinyltransferase [Sulfobacillus thermosulfidooxidans]|uniref:3-phosphoshikimate 1-carboxyvinyltransferase n=1 Tax=Sulfobacillus thermosulfidooxidans TaxID=28034 RepID=UPI0006B41A24|nr:3-phosphoshikimate 1-carboxyvinyltransferase [Sulfobacillus thermosulfidooxidans]
MELTPCNHPVQGILRPPSDKSITHRAILFSALARGTVRVAHPLVAEDTLSSRRLVESLGVSVNAGPDEWILTSPGPTGWQSDRAVIDCGNSGTTMRLGMGLLALSASGRTLIGDASLSQRPMERVARPLRQMGIDVETTQGHAPVMVHNRGPYHGLSYSMPMASAQVKSALILAALGARTPSEIIEPYPTRDHTERMLKQMGARIMITADHHIMVEPLDDWQALSLVPFQVPGDPSSGAFWAALAALIPGSSLTLKEISLSPRRIGFFRLLQQMGSRIDIDMVSDREDIGHLTVTHQPLHAVTVTAEQVPDMIDEIPLVALMATQALGDTVISGAEELRVKETDRIQATVINLKQLGAHIEEKEDGMVIHGPTPLHGGSVRSFGDHRMAMMLAVAAAIASSPVILDDVSSVAISYPTFFEQYQHWQQGYAFHD